jgi:hypothetical protein
MVFDLDGLLLTIPNTDSISSFEIGWLGKNLDRRVMKTSWDKRWLFSVKKTAILLNFAV